MEEIVDELFLDIDEDHGPSVLGEVSYLSFSDTFVEDHQCPQALLSADFDPETLSPTPGSPFSFDSDLDDGFEWEEITDAAPAAAAAGRGGGGGTGGGLGGGGGDADVFGFLEEREILGVMEGIDSGDESGFSDEPPFDFDDGQELDDMFRGVGWEVLAVPLDEDDFEVLPGHVADAAAGGAPPAARAAVERLQVVAIGGEEAAKGCAVCKDGIAQGELATLLPCAHFYHGACIGPWLAIRNSCPVCRYELPTDDPDYERRRRGGTLLVARRCSWVLLCKFELALLGDVSWLQFHGSEKPHS